MRTGLFIPIFGELSDPAVVVELAVDAEAAGFDGFFVWDHIQYRGVPVADPWVVLAAVAAATDRMLLGPLVTPLPRRRVQVLARQTVGVDLLSKGRLVLGVGIAGDGAQELSAFGEETDDKARGDLLDEGLELLDALWTGEEVRHRGARLVADGVTFVPRPVQRPRIPIWVAARHGNGRPLRRAAQHEGWFPIGQQRPEQLATDLAALLEHRPVDLPAPEVVVRGAMEAGHGPWADCGADPRPWAEAGATWWTIGFDPAHMTVAEVRACIQAGPPQVR